MFRSILLDYCVIALIGAVIAVGILILMTRRLQKLQEPALSDTSTDRQAAIFLFRDGVLVQANSAALQFCDDGPLNAFDWPALGQIVKPRFPDFPPAQGAFLRRDFAVLHSSLPQDDSVVTIDQWNGMARVTLAEIDTGHQLNDHVASQAASDAPDPIWKTNNDGQLIWKNAAYDTLAHTLDHPASADAEPLFDTSLLAPDDNQFRTSTTGLTQTDAHWFDIRVVRSSQGTTYYATNANAIVSAEVAQRNFVQTLAKTFAQLSIGLAIFDRDRRLALFNPALIELTALPADFLSSRPSLLAFFDKMRDNRVMPEPKNYASWRDLINDLVDAATDGRYVETWSLPSGLTYRVSGRPHPDGAIAFLFEDISAEISLTRRFRAEIEQNHTVLDEIDTALVLFSATGELLLSNRFYRQLWNTDPDSAFSEYTLRDALHIWRDDTQPSEVWDHVRDALQSSNSRSRWAGTVLMQSGRALRVAVTPVSGGATLVKFDLTLDPNSPTASKSAKLLPV